MFLLFFSTDSASAHFYHYLQENEINAILYNLHLCMICVLYIIFLQTVTLPWLHDKHKLHLMLQILGRGQVTLNIISNFLPSKSNLPYLFNSKQIQFLYLAVTVNTNNFAFINLKLIILYQIKKKKMLFIPKAHYIK